MRYRGGGIGHKYMRAIEEVYENMTRERTHHKEYKRKHVPPDEDAMDVDGASASEGELEEEPVQPQADQHAHRGRQDGASEPVATPEGPGGGGGSEPDDRSNRDEGIDAGTSGGDEEDDADANGGDEDDADVNGGDEDDADANGGDEDDVDMNSGGGEDDEDYASRSGSDPSEVSDSDDVVSEDDDRGEAYGFGQL